MREDPPDGAVGVQLAVEGRVSGHALDREPDPGAVVAGPDRDVDQGQPRGSLGGNVDGAGPGVPVVGEVDLDGESLTGELDLALPVAGHLARVLGEGRADGQQQQQQQSECRSRTRHWSPPFRQSYAQRRLLFAA